VKKKIAIDVDEVVVEFVRGYLEFMKDKGFNDVDYNNVFSYNLWEVLGIDKKLGYDSVFEYGINGGFDGGEFIKGAIEGIEKLKEIFDVYFITARPSEASKSTRDFIFNEFGILGDRVIFSGGYYGGKTKDEICRELGIDLIIEDSEDGSLGYAKNGINVLLLDKPWNRKVEHEKIIRCMNWEEIVGNLVEVVK
jgi:5'(3')-deoxyribonucleotidase